MPRKTDEELRKIVWTFANIPGDDFTVWDEKVGGYTQQYCFRDWCHLFPHKEEDLTKWSHKDFRSWWKHNRYWLNLAKRKKILQSISETSK